MMDHYEEWGISRSASAAEIRHAYRRLMQMLHPDHCVDEAGRRLAELQARRLNGILALLTDPVERERYDRRLSLEASPAGPAPAIGVRSRPPRWLWPSALAAALLAFWLLKANPRREILPPPAAEAIAPAAPAAAPGQSSHTTRPASTSLRGVLGQARIPAASSEARDWLADPPREALPALPAVQPPETDAVERLWETPVSAAPWPVDTPPPPPRLSLAGEWLYVPQPGISSNGLYPPEFIELRVTEAGGVVRGKYRARYRVADRAISPDVAFEFEGRASAPEARLPWTGAGGSRGEVILHLRAADVLEVSWVVQEAGAEWGLVSGHAPLVRKLD